MSKRPLNPPAPDDPRYQDGLGDLPLFAERTTPPALARPPLVPSCDADTSLEAAHHQARSGQARTDERRVYEALLASPDTDDGLEARLNMRHQTCSARRRGLVQKKLVEWTGDYRPTRSGRRAKVWRTIS